MQERVLEREMEVVEVVGEKRAKKVGPKGGKWGGWGLRRGRMGVELRGDCVNLLVT